MEYINYHSAHIDDGISKLGERRSLVEITNEAICDLMIYVTELNKDCVHLILSMLETSAEIAAETYNYEGNTIFYV